MTGFFVLLFLGGFAVAFWLFLCMGSWTIDGVFEIYPGAKRRRAERQRRQASVAAAPLIERPVTLCGCNECMARRHGR